jgi:exonuclease SbcD
MSLRLLHTSDWHLGHLLHGFERTLEHEAALAWLLDTIEAEQVDALLVAGDVFDSANPPTEALATWNRFLVEAWRRHPRLQVVVVGGNHDSAARLDATDPFLRALDRLHVVGGARRPDGTLDVARLAVPLTDRGGAVAAWVAAVPYLRASDTGAGDEAAVAAGLRRFYDEVLSGLRARRTPDQALIAMGHLYLVGGKVSDQSERALTVGNQGAVGEALFPDDLAYVALGHLHLAQQVGLRPHVRYAGSPLPLSLGERGYPHQAVLAVLEGARAAEVRSIRAPRLRSLPRIPAEGAASVEAALAALRALPDATPETPGPWPLVEVVVRLDQPEPALRQRVEEALSGKAARLARLGTEGTGTGLALADVEHRPVAELRPEEVFRLRWARDHQGEPPAALLACLQELLDVVHQEQA